MKEWIKEETKQEYKKNYDWMDEWLVGWLTDWMTVLKGRMNELSLVVMNMNMKWMYIHTYIQTYRKHITYICMWMGEYVCVLF